MATVDPAEIMINDAILHLIDPDDGGYRPSHRALPDLSKTGEFLAGHVANSLSDSQVKGARFVAYRADATPGLLQRLVAGSDFVADSQALARVAYDIMAADKRIKPPGSLAVLRYASTSEPGVAHVAALKLDKGGHFRWIFRTDDETGVDYWDLEESPDAAPGRGERLHKAVFVGPLDPAELAGLSAPDALTGSDDAASGTSADAGVRVDEIGDAAGDGTVASSPPHQFLVLDRQVPDAANWWLEKFLLGALALTDDDRADRWHKGALIGRSQVLDRLEPDQRVALDLAIRAGISGATVDVSEWVAALNMPAPLKTELRAAIDERLSDNAFTVSDSARAKYSKVSWQGDYGLRVTIDAAYSERVTSQPVDGGWLVTINTSRWDQIK